MRRCLDPAGQAVDPAGGSLPEVLVSRSPLLCVVGPTAVGKTALAVGLARRWGAEIVGCDASQVYRGLDVGTGKATPAELDGVRHHLLDVVDPEAPFDAARYVALADAAIADAEGRGRRVIVCGGTGLYLRALLHGLCPAPPLDAAVRATLAARIEAGELPALYAELAAVDPAAAARLPPADRQRIERALGVYLTTGTPLSAWQAAHGFAEERHPAVIVHLTAPRDALVARIEARVAGMFAGGFVEEVRGLVAAGHGPALRSLKALGYRHVAAALAGEMSLREAQRLTLIDSRRYARRQTTWFRAVEGAHTVVAPVDPADLDPYLRPGWGEP